MAAFSKPGDRLPRPLETRGEFVAPAGPVRLRGTAGDRRSEDRGTPDRRAMN